MGRWTTARGLPLSTTPWVAYETDNRTGAFDAYYERPATISLLGDINGKWELEVGCGPGALTEWLVDHGAVVTAIDISPVMAGIATARRPERHSLEPCGPRVGLCRPSRLPSSLQSIRSPQRRRRLLKRAAAAARGRRFRTGSGTRPLRG
jgi:SAM-dependent methyltransferase